MKNEWLSSLKAGDMVAVHRRYGSGHDLATVERVTETQIVTRSHSKYRRKDGRSVGSDSWSATYLSPVTDEIVAAVQHEKDMDLIKEIAHGRRKVSAEALREMARLARTNQ